MFLHFVQSRCIMSDSVSDIIRGKYRLQGRLSITWLTDHFPTALTAGDVKRGVFVFLIHKGENYAL